MEKDTDNIFEIRDGVDIEEIEKRIKYNNIKYKNLDTPSIENIIQQPLLPPINTSYKDAISDIDSNINYVNSNWNIQPEYKISSHRYIIGRLLIWGRKLIHGETKRYVDLLIGKQSEFNKNIAYVLNSINNRINGDIKINETKETDFCTEDRKKDIDINYFIFNELFGGSKEDIRTNAEQFLNFFLGCKNILDIGPGSGIFLELLKEKGIKGYGIDTDDDLILYCKKKDLDVRKDDAISHLKKLDDKFLDGIFISHVIEHLKYEDIALLLRLCYEKMQYGSYMVIATPNILDMTVSSNTFYIDPTHVTHIHPEFIKFLLRTYGFRDIQERFYQPTSNSKILKKIDNLNDLVEEQKKICEIMNHNIETLNNLLFGYRDFAVVAKK